MPNPIVPENPLVGSQGEASVILTEITFPDVTGKTIKGWGTVTFKAGTYVNGQGVPMGLLNWLDQRTISINGLLRCEVYTEEPYVANTSGLYFYGYSPTTDSIQIFNVVGGTEIASGALPAVVLADVCLFEVTVDRTSARG